MHFSSKAPQNGFTFGHILSREVTWSIKNKVLRVVIDPWPGGKSGGLCSLSNMENMSNLQYPSLAPEL